MYWHLELQAFQFFTLLKWSELPSFCLGKSCMLRSPNYPYKTEKQANLSRVKMIGYWLNTYIHILWNNKNWLAPNNFRNQGCKRKQNLISLWDSPNWKELLYHTILIKKETEKTEAINQSLCNYVMIKLQRKELQFWTAA